MKSLIPWNWGTRRLPVTRETEYPSFSSLQAEMNRLFEDYLGGTHMFGPVFSEEELSAFTPKIDMKETENEIIVCAEMPGMHEDEIEISMSAGNLILKGEKKEEKEQNVKGYYRMERRFGSFQRSISLPCEIDSEKVEAFFNHGVIKVMLPKLRPSKTEEKKITVKPMQ